ncbi:apiosidase-like domain-containing protein [Mesorhizobium xinjiangense]|uniref:apiosidase-like domain-containing protein n=1 Tax=Mesorhizobium xinjiangense TaxID=2678685 RepID=UPI001F22D7E3|nr:DUF4038 domain-containing protein [Mesorhizobium xinjiangense]
MARTTARPLMAATVLSIVLAMLSAGQAAACGYRNADGERMFPLRAAPDGRYLEDAAGRPFFMHGDTAWSLIAELPREEVDLYLEDRRERGFNTILVNLLEHRFASNAPANAYGIRPFETPGDYARPSEPYFEHADWVLRRACELGFLVLLTPSYVGNGGGPEGWYAEMARAGIQTLNAYGRFLGERYKDLDNIVWVHGGDYDPPNKNLVRTIAYGIREADTDALHTSHGSPGSAALDYWRGEPWLAINNAYTYGPVYREALRQYADPSAMPFFLMESAYENEHDAGEHRIRVQAYQAVLSGAFGHLFGNNPIWHFSGPGIYDAPVTWQQALSGRGSQSMEQLHRLISSLEWWRLQPDVDGELLVGGRGAEDSRAVAARAGDGSFALAYLPSQRTVELDLARLAGPLVAARWHDPSGDRVMTVEGSPFSRGRRTFEPPATNFAGYGDWVLELTSVDEVNKSQ